MPGAKNWLKIERSIPARLVSRLRRWFPSVSAGPLAKLLSVFWIHERLTTFVRTFDPEHSPGPELREWFGCRAGLPRNLTLLTIPAVCWQVCRCSWRPCFDVVPACRMRCRRTGRRCTRLDGVGGWRAEWAVATCDTGAARSHVGHCSRRRRATVAATVRNWLSSGQRLRRRP